MHHLGLFQKQANIFLLSADNPEYQRILQIAQIQLTPIALHQHLLQLFVLALSLEYKMEVHPQRADHAREGLRVRLGRAGYQLAFLVRDEHGGQLEQLLSFFQEFVQLFRRDHFLFCIIIYIINGILYFILIQA